MDCIFLSAWTRSQENRMKSAAPFQQRTSTIFGLFPLRYICTLPYIFLSCASHWAPVPLWWYIAVGWVYKCRQGHWKVRPTAAEDKRDRNRVSKDAYASRISCLREEINKTLGMSNPLFVQREWTGDHKMWKTILVFFLLACERDSQRGRSSQPLNTSLRAY